MCNTNVQDFDSICAMPNREALLESAITSLQEKGYAGTTARDVADGAGVSLGAIGYHFGTVQELLDAALAEAVRRWFEPLIGLLSRPQPPPSFEQLGPALDRLLDTLAGHRPLVVAYFEALLRAERSLALRTALAADLDAFRQALTGGIQAVLTGQPESASPDPQAAASLVMATFDGLIIQWLLAPERVPSGQLIADTLKRTAALAAVSAESIDPV
jgi:AcrR family transcriptional regulator